MSPFKVLRLRRLKLSVVQRHVLGCVFVLWVTAPVAVLLGWWWWETRNVYAGILAFVVSFTVLGLGLHLGMNPMRKVLLNLTRFE